MTERLSGTAWQLYQVPIDRANRLYEDEEGHSWDAEIDRMRLRDERERGLQQEEDGDAE